MKLQPLTIEVPRSESVHAKMRRTVRAKRSRPSTERFHDLYEATGEILGEGSQGAVHTYRSKQTAVEYAVKIIHKSIDYNRTKVLKEIDIFHHCQGHPNIVELLEYYEEAEHFFLVFERLKGGSLFEHIQRRGHLTEMEASTIIKNLACALNFLHKKGIAHRDLKPENILCENVYQLTPVKICDFDLGNAIILQRETRTPVTTPELMTPVGSAEYMAPEVVDAWVGDNSSYDKKCDLWSLGIILYIMLCGYPPFYAKCGDDCGWERGEACAACQDMLFSRIQEGLFDFPEREWSHISENAKDLIRNLLVRNPRRRFSAEQTLEHVWITDPAPETQLATPRMLSRNNSYQLLDAYAENAMAFNRMMLARITISESLGHSGLSYLSADTHESSPPFLSSEDSQSPKFSIGYSDDEGYDDKVVASNHIPKSCEVDSRQCMLLKLSPPSSKLADRRRCRSAMITE